MDFLRSCPTRGFPSGMESMTCSRSAVSPKTDDTQNHVNTKDTNEMTEQNNITGPFPYRAAHVANSNAPISAPALPEAAHTPFSVDRHGLENVMEGSM